MEHQARKPRMPYFKRWSDLRVDRALKSLAVPMTLLVEWGDHAEKTLLRVREACEIQYGRELSWRVGPWDRIYRLRVGRDA